MDPRPTSFLTLAPGTPVVDRFGRAVGAVDQVLVHEDGGFDGVIVQMDAGRRFVDAPEVRRISRGAVTLGSTLAEVERPSDRRVRGVPEARYGENEATEADRDAVIDALKRAFIADRLTADQLGRRVAIAHVSETLDGLDAALEDLGYG